MIMEYNSIKIIKFMKV